MASDAVTGELGDRKHSCLRDVLSRQLCKERPCWSFEPQPLIRQLGTWSAGQAALRVFSGFPGHHVAGVALFPEL